MSPVSWDTPLEEGSGLIDDFDFTCTRAIYAPDADYGVSDIVLALHGSTNDPEFPETKIILSCGKKWESRDGGKSITYPGKPDKFFDKKSMVGRWIERMIDDLGMKAVLAGRGNPLEAKVWVGLQLHVMREDITYEGLDSSGKKPMPTKFIGVVEGGVAAAAPAAAPVAAAAPAAPATAPAAAAAPAGETAAQKVARMKGVTAPAAAANGAPSIRDQAKAVLASAPDFATGQALAFEMPGMASADDVLGEMLDEETSTLWAEVVAERGA